MFVIYKERNTEGSPHYADFAFGKRTTLTYIANVNSPTYA